MFIFLWAYYYCTHGIKNYFLKMKSINNPSTPVPTGVSVSFDGSIVLNKNIEEIVTDLDVYVYKNPFAMYELKKIVTSTSGVRIYFLQNSLDMSSISMAESTFNKLFKVKEITFSVGKLLEKIRGGHD